MLSTIPPNPEPDPSSSAWVAAANVGNSLGRFQFFANQNGYARDFGFPIYYTVAKSDPHAETVKISCKGYGGCVENGVSLTIDSRDLPEDYGTDGDRHMAFIDSSDGYEHDFFQVQWPPSKGVLTATTGGQCSLRSSGFSDGGCSATASSAPQSIGLVRATDLLYALKSSNGTLPYAIAVATQCNSGWIAPASNGDDGDGCEKGPPMGARFYLALHDAHINSLPVSDIVKVLLRTMDQDHYGAMLTASNPGQTELTLQRESDLTYTVYGQSGPWVSQFIPEARNEGLPGASAPDSDGTYYIQLPLPANLLSDYLRVLKIDSSISHNN